MLLALFVALVAGQCTLCKAPVNTRAVCGPAYRDWLARGGFAQFEGTDCLVNSTAVALSSFCGAQPVYTWHNFTFVNQTSNFSAWFATADGSCTCDYCYSIEDFDSVAVGSLPPCWTSTRLSSSPARDVEERDAEARYGGQPRWKVSNTYYYNAPNSVGLRLTGPRGYGGYSRNHLTWAELSSPILDFYKSRITFWLKVVNLRPSEGEYVEFFLRANNSTNGTRIPAANILRCPYNFTSPNTGLSGWTGTFECIVEVDISSIVLTQTLQSHELVWAVAHTIVPYSITTTTGKRVEPPTTTTTYPEQGVWVDDVRFCGNDLPVAPVVVVPAAP